MLASSVARPGDEQVLDGVAGRLAGVVPAFEGGDHDRVSQLHVTLDVHHPASLRSASRPDERSEAGGCADWAIGGDGGADDQPLLATRPHAPKLRRLPAM